MSQLVLWVTCKYSNKIVCRDCLKTAQLIGIKVEPSVIVSSRPVASLVTLCMHITYVILSLTFDLRSPVVQHMKLPGPCGLVRCLAFLLEFCK